MSGHPENTFDQKRCKIDHFSESLLQKPWYNDILKVIDSQKVKQESYMSWLSLVKFDNAPFEHRLEDIEALRNAQIIYEQHLRNIMKRSLVDVKKARVMNDKKIYDII